MHNDHYGGISGGHSAARSRSRSGHLSAAADSQMELLPSRRMDQGRQIYPFIAHYPMPLFSERGCLLRLSVHGESLKEIPDEALLSDGESLPAAAASEKKGC